MRRPKQHLSLRNKAIIAVLVLVLLWLVFLIVQIVPKEELARHAADDAQRELLLLKERERALKDSLADMKTARGEEAIVRETYGVARAGEEVIIVVPEAVEEVAELPWWRRVLGWFGL